MHFRRPRLSLALLAAMAVLSAAPISADAATPTVSLAPDGTRQVALGAAVDSDTLTSLDRFTARTGATPATVLVFKDWGWHGMTFEFKYMLPELSGIVARGSMPIVTWSPQDSVDRYSSRYSLRSIVGGTHDAFLHRWAAAARDWGKPFLLRPMHEMNSYWEPWGSLYSGNSAALFVAAWRHIVDIFHQEGATNVSFVWCVSRWQFKKAPLAPLYPGDAYVDLMGFDAYNSSDVYQTIPQLYGPVYKSLVTLSAKPIIVAETASLNNGDKAAWVRDGYNAVYNRFPRIVSITYFDRSQSTKDWRLATPAAALAAYRLLLQQQRLQGRFQ
jgi:beta-mannanase